MNIVIIVMNIVIIVMNIVVMCENNLKMEVFTNHHLEDEERDVFSRYSRGYSSLFMLL